MKKTYKLTEAQRRYYRDYRRAHPQDIEKVKAKRREWQMRTLYGDFSETKYQELYKKQEGCCAICNTFQLKLFVDHVHDETKRVRGLLCMHCNFVLGSAKDNPLILIRAAEYLQR